MNRTQQRSRAHPAALAAAFLAGVIVALGVPGHTAPQYELAAGYCHSQRAPDGVWHESQFAENNDVNAACGQIGLRFDLAKSWGVRLAYTDFGLTSSDAHAVNDEYTANDVKMGRLSCEPHPSTRGCISQWKGSGTRTGVSAGLFHTFTLGAWKLQPEIGVIRYHYSWHDDVTQFQSLADSVAITESSTSDAPYAAVSVQRGFLIARVEYFNHLKGGIAQGSAVNALIGAAGSF